MQIWVVPDLVIKCRHIWIAFGIEGFLGLQNSNAAWALLLSSLLLSCCCCPIVVVCPVVVVVVVVVVIVVVVVVVFDEHKKTFAAHPPYMERCTAAVPPASRPAGNH